MVHGLVVAMSCRAVRCDAIEMRFADACTRPEDRLASDTVSLSLGMANRPLSDPLPKTRGPRTPSSQRAPLSSRVLRSTTNHSVVDWWHYDVLRTYEHRQQANRGRRHDTTPFNSPVGRRGMACAPRPKAAAPPAPILPWAINGAAVLGARRSWAVRPGPPGCVLRAGGRSEVSFQKAIPTIPVPSLGGGVALSAVACLT